MARRRVPTEFLFWGGLLFVGTAYELRALRTKQEERTLSDVTRDVFRVDTRAGRIAFTLAWGGFTAWYAHHILSHVKET